MIPTNLEFFMDMIPPKITAQQKGISRGRVYTKPEVRAAKSQLCAHLAKWKPNKPQEGIIAVRVMFIFPWYKKDAKIALKRSDEFVIFHKGKPDLDNMVKLLFDCMTDMGFWKDDSQVVDARISKHRGNRPGIAVMIKETKED